MKTKITFIILFIGLGSALHGLVNFGDAGTMDLNVTGSLAYDSEIRSRAIGLSDTILTIRPSLTYSRPSKNFTLSASAGVTLYRYFDYNEYDEDDFFFDLNIAPNAGIETSRFSFEGDLILNSETRSDEQVGDIITTQNYGVSGELTYHPNRNFSVVADASWRRQDPDSDFYNKFDRYGGGLRVQVPVKQPDILWYVGVDYEDIQSNEDTVSDSNTFTYLTGISGTLMPKLQGSVAAGFQQRSFDSGGDSNSPYFSCELMWTVDELTRISLNGSTSVGTTLNDYATESTRLSLELNRELNRRLSLAASIEYEMSDFKRATEISREDEAWTGNIRTSYRLTDWGRLGLFASYSDRTSDEAFYEYDRTRIGIDITGTW